MIVTISAQVKLEMRDALKATASADLCSLSVTIRRALDDYLRRRGITWRLALDPQDQTGSESGGNGYGVPD